MIELTTGVVFLMSSLYGSGQSANQINSVPANQLSQASQTQVSNAMTSAYINDPKAMEAYLRVQYSDTPLLVDIARCESNFHQFDSTGNIVRGRVDPHDIGVMQINETYQGPTAQKLGYNIYTVEGNVAYAKHLYEQQGPVPWQSSAACWSDTDIARNGR